MKADLRISIKDFQLQIAPPQARPCALVALGPLGLGGTGKDSSEVRNRSERANADW